MCVSPRALVSALAARLRAGGRPATRDELAAILGSGCARADLAAALAEEGAGFAAARALLEALDDPPRRATRSAQ